jgi:hypothetical protein
MNGDLSEIEGQYSNESLEQAIRESGFELYGYTPEEYYNDQTTVFPYVAADGTYWYGPMHANYELVWALKENGYYKLVFRGTNAVVMYKELTMYYIPANVKGPDGKTLDEPRLVDVLYDGEIGESLFPYRENWWK